MRTAIPIVLLLVVLTAMVYAQENPIQTGIRTDKERYRFGEPVQITFAAENRSQQPVTLNFRTGQHYDLWVTQNGREIWRWSAGRAFTQALTSFTLAPNERRTYEATWNQQDAQGRQVAPGSYQIWGELTIENTMPERVSRRAAVGGGPAVVIATVGAVVATSEALLGRVVSIDATYRGQRPDPEAPACRPGPPVTRADWAIQDKTGCIFVTGPTTLDPVNDIGKNVRVLGVVQKTQKGQPFIELQSMTVLP